MTEPLKLFALPGAEALGEQAAAALGRALDSLEWRDFEDGEHKARPMTDVRGADAFVIAALHGGPEASPNDRLCGLLFFLATLRDHGAARVTAVVPYLAYARKDRRTKTHDPLTIRYVAQLFEAVGCDRVVAMEPHNLSAFQNAFRCEAVALDARSVLLEAAAELARDGGPFAVASPDPGGVKRAQLFREALEARLDRPLGFAMMEKRRSAGVVSGEMLAGDVKGAKVLLVDDLIASGGTLLRAARACLEAGARQADGLAVHGLFTRGAARTLADPALSRVIVSDTVPPFRLTAEARERIEIHPAAPAFAETIRRLNARESVEDLTIGPS
ncbi:MAG: ribose-phosphate diphosphokinase [Pseudomonadota bacterium]